MHVEEERIRLLATVEKQKLRTGAFKESEEALFRDMIALDDVISEMEKELREAGKDLWQSQAGEWNEIKAKERRETEAAGGGVTWKAACGVDSSEAEIGGVAGKSLEEMSFVPRAVKASAGWHEPLRVKFLCDKKCNKEGFRFCENASILVEDDDKERIKGNQCSLEGMVEHKGLSRQTVGRLRVRWFRQKNVGAIHGHKAVCKASVGRSNESGAVGNNQQLAD